MGEDSITLQILKLYQRKYNIVNEIYRLTEEMGQLIARDDRVSTQMVLGMRQDEMNKADQCGADIAIMEDQMECGQRSHLRALLSDGPERQEPLNFEENKLIEINCNIRQTLKKTIEIDKRINLKLAGQDSFYQKNVK